MKLVLSIFPGIGLLDRAFEQEGFAVVRGPDLLWGGDVRSFHPPSGKFDGVIGGPPCQAHSQFAHIARHRNHRVAEDLIPEFERVVAEAQPAWFVMENVRGAREANVGEYCISSFLLNNRWLGEEQYRIRRFSFGIRGPGPGKDLREHLELAALENMEWSNTVLASGGMKPGAEKLRGKKPGKLYGYATRTAVATALKLQGLPADFFEDSPFRVEAQHEVVGNGVPLPMGRAIARAVKCALELEAVANGDSKSEHT